jgi:adenylate cyclase
MRRPLAALLLGSTAFLLVIGIEASGAGERLELLTLDARYATAIGRRPPGRDIVIAWIDQDAMDLLDQDGTSFPWPRSVYAAATDYVMAGGARSIVFDVLFDQRGQVADDDREFGASLQKARSTVLACKFVTSRHGGRTPEETAAYDARALPFAGAASSRAPEHGVVLPIPELAAGADELGFVNIQPDTDKVYRRYDLLRRWQPADGDATVQPSLALAATLSETSFGRTGWHRLPDGRIGVGESTNVAADAEARMLLNFRGPEFTFEHVKFANILQSIQQVSDNETPLYPAERFRGKTVFVGINAEGYEDIHPTPLSRVFPGVELHATALDNLQRSDALSAPRWELPLAAVAAAAGTAAVFLVPGVGLAVLAVAVLGAVFLAATLVAWAMQVALPVAAPLLALVFAAGGSFLWRLVVEGRRRREMKRAFSSYMAPEVLAEVLKDPDRIALGGETREVTLFFTDLAGFTGLAEHVGPDALVRFLNDYFTRMCEPILQEHGVIDKFIGDAIMALFGAPVGHGDHPLRAVRAALAAAQVSAAICQELRTAGKPAIETRIGIHTGPAVVGNMGSAKRFDYTAIGDTVNLASRLEGANKAFGTRCLVSETAWQGCGEQILGREVGLVAVKGREQPIRVFTPVAVAATAGTVERTLAKAHADALAKLRAGDRPGARAAFQRLGAANGSDPLAALYAARCADEAWNGVFSLDSK